MSAMRANNLRCAPVRLEITALAICAFATAPFVVGCISSDSWVTVRDTPRNPLARSLDLVSPTGPEPTNRTMQLLRRYNLEGQWSGNRTKLLASLEEIQLREPNREHEYAMAELAYISAKESEVLNRQRALEYYGTALIHAYRYLFDFEDQLPLNAYDPQFRGASDLYNQSLEGVLRLVHAKGDLRPGERRTIRTSNHLCTYDIVMRASGWHEDDFERFEFVSDYRVQGLRNHYHDYGLGVPLIAVRSTHQGEDPAEDYYPPNLCFPITAFLRVDPAETGTREARLAEGKRVFNPPPIEAGPSDAAPAREPRFVLELYDPLERQSIEVGGRNVPLESDLSTPLAYFLDLPQFKESQLPTVGLLDPDATKDFQGLYMLEPFDPEKMPVVMVHGLWSSPVTWMEMFNDLRSDPLVRQRYQFWFYMYPTGQPFWISGTQMREDLAMMRRRIDPERTSPALDQMVLVGHSMGGLVSKMQTVDSGEEFWRTTSEHEFAELKADPEVTRALANSFFFSPNASVKRVVTIGTPHRGSQFANGTTRWLGQKLISLPKKMIKGQQQLLAKNPGFFRRNSPVEIATSIDSLAPDSPVLPVLLTAPPGPWVEYHNVAGNVPDLGWRKLFVDDGDGVVSLASAHLDGMPQLRSQIDVPSDHVNVHRHPQSILEVRRILLEQVAELESFPNRPAIMVAGAASAPRAGSAALPLDGAAAASSTTLR